jgi:hypothetical protein
MSKRRIERGDVLIGAEYANVRVERRQAVAGIKRYRRLAVGPDITFYFESYDTMLHQVQEMVHIEKGGEAQIADELAAYDPLIPQGRELVATTMIEIDDPVRRGRMLAALGGIEETVALIIGDDQITAVAEHDVERTTDAGKTLSIHFLRFPLTDAQADAFRAPGTRAVLAIEHAGYGHMAVVQEDAPGPGPGPGLKPFRISISRDACGPPDRVGPGLRWSPIATPILLCQQAEGAVSER